MSKHEKTNILTKVLGYSTVAIVGGTAVVTFLPNSYYSSGSIPSTANILSSVEQLASPLTGSHAHAPATPATSSASVSTRTTAQSSSNTEAATTKKPMLKLASMAQASTTTSTTTKTP